ncbi:lipid kinase, YegS/Rv2252/BmrU family [Alkalibacterium subtropicum]|uniref:Lipid kinase, YegS/Rv2252/BmrU family n=1 Tax=Alkalibacterium subtropicum TaxID=753702 RepID=A0A1I1LHD2_9LACT|nr:diacylglycerol kinase family protein [Alkalibacterium subtropicum]SFC72411.1 lipid kinase, YegS/Rv2252/BmrU family [Alkalibacterium subtropicum]
MNDVMIIANPSSGKKKAEEYADKLKQNFLRHDRKAVIKITEKIEDVSRFAVQASEEAYQHLIIIGGDGTVSEAANGLRNQKYRPVIGIVPSGTVNNIAKGLNLPADPEQTIAQMSQFKEKKADAGRVNDRIFLSSVSAGPVPETVWEVSEEQKEKLGQAAYFMEGVKSLRSEETYDMELTIDGKKVDIDLNLILAGVNGSIAGIPNFFDEAKIDDGKLYLFGLKRSTLGQKLTVLQALFFSNKEFNDMQDAAFTVSFKRAVCTVKNKEAFTTVDGDQGPAFPVIIEVLPQYFTFLVPA